MMLAQSSIQSIMKGSVTTVQKKMTYSLKLSATTGEIFWKGNTYIVDFVVAVLLK